MVGRVKGKAWQLVLAGSCLVLLFGALGVLMFVDAAKALLGIA